MAVTGIGELALVRLPVPGGSRRRGCRGTGALDPVHDHLGHGELALHGFATGLEVERLGQAAPVVAALRLGLGIDPGAGEGERDLLGLLLFGRSPVSIDCSRLLDTLFSEDCSRWKRPLRPVSAEAAKGESTVETTAATVRSRFIGTSQHSVRAGPPQASAVGQIARLSQKVQFRPENGQIVNA